jgi:hypothetical protein
LHKTKRIKYKSPFHFINPNITAAQVKFERKRIIAQFEINNNQPFIIEKQVFTKTETLELLDELESEKKFNFHKVIFGTPFLLSFLEEGIVQKITISHELKALLKLSEFIEFISPYFAFQYSSILCNGFITQNSKQILQLKQLPFLCSDAFYDACYNKAFYEFSNLCEQLNKDIRLVEKNKNGYLFRQYYYEKDELNHTINALPDYFSTKIDFYIELLLKAVINCYNYGNRDIARFLIDQARCLNCSEDIKNIVTNYYEQIKELDPLKMMAAEKPSGKNSTFLLVTLLILLCVVIPFVVFSLVGNKNAIPLKYKKINLLDTLISNSYKYITDSSFYYYESKTNNFKVGDSIHQAKETTNKRNESHLPINYHSKQRTSFSRFINTSSFEINDPIISNIKSSINLINNTPYDVTMFFVVDNKVICDIHLYSCDSVQIYDYKKKYHENIIFNIWLYVGLNLLPKYNFKISSKEIGYGYYKQPYHYKGIYNSNQSFQFSRDVMLKDTMRVDKYYIFSFEFKPIKDSLVLNKKSNYFFDTIYFKKISLPDSSTF